MKLFLQCEDGQLREFVAKSSDSMIEVRRKISDAFGVPPSRQKLWFGGNQLEDAPTLAHALWNALKKVQGATDSSGRVDLDAIKDLCSPAASPVRGMSPASSVHKDLDKSGMDATSTLEGAASALSSAMRGEGSPTAQVRRKVSPERRRAALALESQYNNMSMEEEEEAEIEMGVGGEERGEARRAET